MTGSVFFHALIALSWIASTCSAQEPVERPVQAHQPARLIREEKKPAAPADAPSFAVVGSKGDSRILQGIAPKSESDSLLQANSKKRAGPPGETGPTGKMGGVGPPGEPGADANFGSLEMSELERGDPGPHGVEGSSGDRGERGVMGPPGDAGPAGKPGKFEHADEVKFEATVLKLASEVSHAKKIEDLEYLLLASRFNRLKTAFHSVEAHLAEDEEIARKEREIEEQKAAAAKAAADDNAATEAAIKNTEDHDKALEKDESALLDTIVNDANEEGSSFPPPMNGDGATPEEAPTPAPFIGAGAK